MQFKRTLSAALAVATVVGMGEVHADHEYPMDNAPDTKDIDFLRNWFKTKRAVSIDEKGGDLSMSGDVRVEYNGKSGRHNGNPVFGTSTGNVRHEFKNRVDLFFDYRTCHTWAHIKLKFDNTMGVISGTTNKLVLEKGILGYRIFDNGKSAIVDLELGRTKLYNFFDSKVQFGAMFDGGSFRIANSFDRTFDFDFRAAYGVVAQKSNQYFAVAEADFMDIGETGVYLKYAYTHWRKHGSSQRYETPSATQTGWQALESLQDNPQFKFQISQFLVGYQMDPEVLRFPLKIYGAFLVNHAAKEVATAFATINHKEKTAWYAGFTAGQVVKRGDWSAEVIYQSVGAQSVPDFDMSGIGNANPDASLIYAHKGIGSVAAPFGNTNFKGWRADLMFAVTNNVSLLLEYDWSKNRKKQIGSSELTFDYHRFGASAIYAF